MRVSLASLEGHTRQSRNHVPLNRHVSAVPGGRLRYCGNVPVKVSPMISGNLRICGLLAFRLTLQRSSDAPPACLDEICLPRLDFPAAVTSLDKCLGN
jgi:hypothetical protein